VPVRIKAVMTTDILIVARQIQGDLIRITSLVNSSIGLWQVYDWTSVQLDTFFNFLSLPDTSSGGMDHSITMMEVRKTAEAPKAVVRPTSVKNLSIPMELHSTLSFQNAHVPTIDVEVAIRDGALDVGVFGPTSLMSLQQAEAFAEDFKRILITQIQT